MHAKLAMMPGMKHWGWLLVLAACGGPADVGGNYTIALTNRDNGCTFQGWNVGDQTTGVSVVITQSGSSVSADVKDLASVGLDAALGSHTFTGSVNGDKLSLAITGTKAQSMGNCAFTYNATITATSSGDALTGRIDYTAATNGNSDCATLQGCLSFQDFNGTRPPQ